MADNTTLNTGTGGDTLATDDISGVKYPRSKITIGADGVNDGDVSSANPLPISGAVTNAGTFVTQINGDALTALQLIDNAVSGAGFNITQFAGAAVPIGGGVEATAVRVTIASNSTGVLSVDDNGGSLTVDGTVAISGTVTVGSHAVTNAGTFAVQAAQSGTWNVGTVTTVTTVSTVTNLSQLGGVAIAMNTGTRSSGTQRVTIATDDIVPASQSGTWTVQPGNTANTTAWLVNDNPVTSGGLSVSSFLSTAAVQSTSVKGSAGQVYSLEFFNVSATPVYVRLYNKATADDGSGTPIWRGVVPGDAAGAGFVKTWDKGLAFSIGIAMRCTGAIADNDTTALSANVVTGNVCYK